MKNGNFYIDLLGCEKRKLDAEKIIKFFQSNNYNQIEDKKDIKNADFVIFVSCAFNDEFTNLSKEKINSLLLEKKDDAKFILSGCLPNIHPDFLIDKGIEYFAGPRELEKMDNFINPLHSINEIPDQNLSFFDNREYPTPDTDFRSEILKEYINSKNSFKIRVTWGCLSNCSYCSIKKATKNLKSKSLDDIMREFDSGISLGYENFFITGGDVGAYGVDIGLNITNLIELLTSRKNINLFIQEFNAQWLIKHSGKMSDILLKNINNYKKLFINIPIQSGSDIVLKKMRRYYKVEDVYNSISQIRYCNHKIKIGSHFIVGFLGEDEDEYNKTKDLISKLKLDFNMIFTYSDTLKLKAESISPYVMNKRREELLCVQKEIDISSNRYVNLSEIDINELNIFNLVQGWLTEKEAKLLYNLSKTTKGNIIEVGSWKGLSTIFIALGLIQGKSNKFLYSIDHHMGSKEHQQIGTKIFTLPEFAENIRLFNVGDVIKTMIMTSEDASKLLKDDISLIFIDASHEYEDVKNDFILWWDKLELGGIMMFHDTLSKNGVSKFIDEIIKTQDDIGDPILLHEITYFKKIPKNKANIKKNEFFLLEKENSQINLYNKRKLNEK